MAKGGKEDFTPLYIGKAEKKGVRHPISANIANIRSNRDKFARWGDSVAYHIGDLSHALFEFDAYKKPDKKYMKWAEILFTKNDPPTLNETVLY